MKIAPDRPPLRLVPLGTNGFFPTFGRQTMSYLLIAPPARTSGCRATAPRAVLLDAGTGAGRLAEPEVRSYLAGVERLDIVLTHYHLDHVVGISYLPGLCPELPVTLHAPGPPLVDAEPGEVFARLFPSPLFPLALESFAGGVEVVPYAGDELAVADGIRFALRRQEHPGGSVGLRLDDRLAYVTDTVADPATADFVSGVDVLLHEVWLDAAEAEEQDAGDKGHSSAPEVARLAEAAGVSRLVPVHHHPRRDAAGVAALGRELDAATRARVLLPEEGRAIEIA